MGLKIDPYNFDFIDKLIKCTAECDINAIVEFNDVNLVKKYHNMYELEVGVESTNTVIEYLFHNHRFLFHKNCTIDNYPRKYYKMS